AAVPLLVLVVAYLRVRGFALDVRWALAAVVLAAGLTGAAALAMRQADAEDAGASAEDRTEDADGDDPGAATSASVARHRAGAHAAGAVGALALACAMLLTEQWLTLAVALFLPPLAWIEARTDLAALRRVALAVAGVVLVRLLLNGFVLGYAFAGPPVLNTLLLAYGVPAACFALAAVLFRRRGDDATVAVLEAGALAFLTALALLEVRHAMTGGSLAAYPDGDRFWSFREAAFQCLALALLATGVRRLDARLGGRAVLAWGWRAQQAASMLLGLFLLLVVNPAIHADSGVIGVPVFNELLIAYALPALLAAAAARAPETAWPEGARPVLGAYALAMLFGWVTLEVRHHFQPAAMLLDLAPPEGAELYAYSLAWLGLGAALLAVGVQRGVKALRLAALALIALTVLKAFLVDMGGLGGLWRVLSFLGLGLALIALGWVYRRFVVAPPATPPPPASPA
ncbi:MAG: DUF2339 domain-containing protein, partial [Acetobacteraceae bacterium]|nr:DUF2339 domain-containing protein [Acetobacteraceae bacterium]